MSAHATRPAVDLDRGDQAHPVLALVLALLSVPGSTVAWDLPAGGLYIGLPLALAAIFLGLRARSVLAGRKGSGMALAAIVVAGLMIAQMVAWTVVSLVS